MIVDLDAAQPKLSETEEKLLNEVYNRCLQPWRLMHPFHPVLYHYTNASGAHGILTSKSFWMTDLRYMNDLSEMEYSRQLVLDRLKVRVTDKSLDAAVQDFLARLIRGFDPFGERTSVFSMSFCERDNLLSQWRAYRDQNGGYAIGIDFFHIRRMLSKHCALRRVIYHPKEQTVLIDSVIDAFASTTATLIRADLDRILPFYLTAFSHVMSEMIFAFKHPDFEEEREWRLVHMMDVAPTESRGCEMPKFRVVSGNLVPYIEVSFEKPVQLSRASLFGLAFPIVDIMIGPTVDPSLNGRSMRNLLLMLNPDVVPRVRNSGIPLRWL